MVGEERRPHPSAPENWCILYPVYINSEKTVAEGRRLPREKCVKHPTLKEIFDVLEVMKINRLPEPKSYPRGFHAHEKGRIRFQLRKEDGSPCHPDLPSRTFECFDLNTFENGVLGTAVMERVASLISKLSSRTNAEQQQSTSTDKPKKKKK
eukprot:c4423_g1_i1.p1 GENE.c4423_g1_i1~~c4423_g1_i1.p1  ORF type:complete len:152 (+),score=24.78 c4423_g1_i1:48-503(+)